LLIKPTDKLKFVVQQMLSGECREDYIHLAPRGVGNTGDPKLFTCKCLFIFVTRFITRPLLPAVLT